MGAPPAQPPPSKPPPPPTTTPPPPLGPYSCGGKLFERCSGQRCSPVSSINTDELYCGCDHGMEWNLGLCRPFNPGSNNRMIMMPAAQPGPVTSGPVAPAPGTPTKEPTVTDGPTPEGCSKCFGTLYQRCWLPNGAGSRWDVCESTGENERCICNGQPCIPCNGNRMIMMPFPAPQPGPVTPGPETPGPPGPDSSNIDLSHCTVEIKVKLKENLETR